MWIEKKEQRLIIYQECLRLKREGKEDIDELFGYSKYICRTWRSYPSYVKHVYY